MCVYICIYIYMLCVMFFCGYSFLSFSYHFSSRNLPQSPLNSPEPDPTWGKVGAMDPVETHRSVGSSHRIPLGVWTPGTPYIYTHIYTWVDE